MKKSFWIIILLVLVLWLIFQSGFNLWHRIGFVGISLSLLIMVYIIGGIHEKNFISNP
tara:strand:- start:1960 stop:2133 length:174 start_codon:yes stop_codon:yes gene_type:complete